MIGDNQVKQYSDDYIETAFTVWYSMGQPTNFDKYQDALPISPNGDKPSKPMLKQFRDNFGWHERADGLTALAVQKNEDLLVNNKAEMLRQMAQDASEIRKKAMAQIMESGFDTSASAVNAYFKASEEERTVRGVSDMVIKISKMSNDEILARRTKLLSRRNEALDGEVLEDTDANTNSDTP